MPLHKRIIVLDTSAILAGIQSSLPGTEAYTTQLVVSEAKRKLKQENKEDNMDVGSLIIMEPSLQFVNSIIQQATHMGEMANLSPTDVSVLALAKQLSDYPSRQTEILTDDYSIQNVAAAIGLKYHSIVTKRITKEIMWKYYCKGCRRVYKITPKDLKCSFCGSDIIRKPTHIRSVKNGSMKQ